MQENRRDFSLFKSRILQYLERKGITKYECYKNTGITNGILSQKTGLSEENVLKFLSYYTDISTDWFFTGKGEMLLSPRYPDAPLPAFAAESGVRYGGKRRNNAPDLSGFGDSDSDGDENKKELLLRSIKKLADAADRNSVSIAKMVETANNNTKIVERLVTCLIEKGIEMP